MRKLVNILIVLIMISACSENEHQHAHDAEEAQTYTCPMHPQIIQNTPGTCPVCFMDLVVFEKGGDDHIIKLDSNRRLLANITTTNVGITETNFKKRLNGRLVANPGASHAVSSRVEGRIEQLVVKESGVQVKKGQLIYRIYSEQLATLQQEYLLAVAQVRQFPDDSKYKQIADASKHKLLLLGQSRAQIEAMVKKGNADPYVAYYSPASGTITELLITEGQYVEEGNLLFQLEDYSNLWVEADLYAMEAQRLKKGQQVDVQIAGWENEPVAMEIQFINPSLDFGSQLYQIRGSITNLAGQWQPGLQATIYLPAEHNEGALNLPVDAVIRTEAGSHIWVETSEGTFEPRQVVLGSENSESVEILEGIKRGEKVVITGAYLLYSEFVLKTGKQPSTAHRHSS